MNGRLSTRKFEALGRLLKNSRGKSRPVREVADMLGVSRSFVYQVEQGSKKPKREKIEQWASVYGIPSMELWQATGQLPLRPAPIQTATEKGSLLNKFSQLSENEKDQLQLFVEFLLWKKQQSRT